MTCAICHTEIQDGEEFTEITLPSPVIKENGREIVLCVHKSYFVHDACQAEHTMIIDSVTQNVKFKPWRAELDKLADEVNSWLIVDPTNNWSQP